MKEFRYEASDADGRPIHGIMKAADRDALSELLDRRGQKLVSAVSIEIVQPHSDLAGTPLRLSELRITESVRTAFLTQLPVDVALQAAAREPTWNPATALLPWFQGSTLLLLILAILHAAITGTVATPLYVAVSLVLLAFGPAWMLVRASEQRPRRLLRQIAANVRAGTTDLANMARLLPGNLGEIVRSDLPDDQKMLVLSELMSGTSGAGFARHRLFLSLLAPVFLLMMSLGVCYAFLTLVIPGFREIFESFDLDLPGLTMLIIMTSRSVEFMGLPGAVALAMVGVLAITGLFLVIYRGWLQSALLSTPLIGAGLRWIDLAGVARWLAAMLRNNAPPGEALRIATSQSHADAIRQDGRRLAAMIREGKVLSNATTSLSGLPLSLLVGLAKEPTDSRRRYAVASTLDSLGGMFDRAVFSTGRIVAAVLQVLLLIIVSGVIGLTILALFLPLVGLLNALT